MTRIDTRFESSSRFSNVGCFFLPTAKLSKVWSLILASFPAVAHSPHPHTHTHTHTSTHARVHANPPVALPRAPGPQCLIDVQTCARVSADGSARDQYGIQLERLPSWFTRLLHRLKTTGAIAYRLLRLLPSCPLPGGFWLVRGVDGGWWMVGRSGTS